MLPGFVESGYKRYKRDTSTFTTWLSEAGKECGYKSQALKGNRAPKLQDGPFVVPLKELVPLAKAIAKSESPSVFVPIQILRAGVRAVSLRKRSTDRFKRQTISPQAAQSNDRHSYFTSLMEEAINTLGPRIPGSLRRHIPDSSSKNIFSVLEAQFSDLDGDEAGSGDLVPFPIEVDTDPRYELEILTDAEHKQEEKTFALFCYFDDLHKLQVVIQKAWVNYLIGRSDIITASMITNTAFQLAIRTQEELVAVYPDSGNYSVVLEFLLSRIAKESGSSVEVDQLKQGAIVGGGVATWLFAPAHQLLDSFCDVLNPGEVPMMKRGHFGVYNPSSNRKSRTFEENHKQDLILLIELLPEFALLSRYKINQMAEDEFTKGLRNMCTDKKIPIWLVFAATTFLDIHHLMKDKASQPFEDLQRMGTYAVETLDSHFAFSRNITSPQNWTSGVQNALIEVYKGFKHTILDDIIFKAKKNSWKQIGMMPGQSEKFYLYKRHPTLCGMLAYRMQLEMQFFGIQLCTAWGTVIHPAHLCHALKHNKSLKISVWPLMYRVVEIHGEDRIFVGGKPENIIDSYKQISLVLGYSAENFAANRRDRTTIISKNGPRGLNNTSALSEIFRRGLATDGSMALTMHNVERLFKEQAQSAQLQTSTTKNKKDLRKEWASTKRLSSLELLEALGNSLPAEVKFLQFNYFKIHQESITLLRHLKTALHTDFEKYIGNNYIENESQLPFIASYIIMIASSSNRAAATAGIATDGDSKVLVKAAKVFELFLENGRI